MSAENDISPSPQSSPLPQKKGSKGGLILIVAVIAMVMIIIFRTPKPVTELFEDYSTALAEAKAKDKPLLLIFLKVEEHNSSRIFGEVLNRKDMADILGKFTVVVLDSEKNPGIVQEYDIDSFPTCVALWPGSEVDERTGGIIKPDRLVPILEETLQAKP